MEITSLVFVNIIIQLSFCVCILAIYSPVANSELFGRPIFNHILDKKDCLADPLSILKLSMKSLKVEDIEVYTLLLKH